MNVSKKLVVTLNLVLISIMLSGCGTKTQDVEAGKAASEIKQKIVFVQQYTNYSDTYTNKGFFIDNKGNKILYDLSAEDKKYADGKELLTYLEALRYKPSDSSISMKDLTKYYKLLYKIDLNYEVKEKSSGADQGSDILYGVVYDSDQTPVMVLIDEKGDWNRENTDPNAVKISDGIR